MTPQPTDRFMDPSSRTGERRDSLRMLDANINRANEALRTLEDVARFRDLAAAQIAYKKLRHELQAVVQAWPSQELLAARHTASDVGTDQKTDSETVRSGGMLHIATAAANRLQQSLRCIEESAKHLFPDSALAVEKIRYACYDLNANSLLSLQRDLDFLRHARLYLLVDCQLPLKEFSERIAAVANAGVDLIQIRDKQKDALDLLAYIREAQAVVDATKTRIIVNDRADIARLSNAYGLHVGQTDLTIAQSRSLIRPEAVVGLSTHDITQVQEAIQLSADYVGCGPTFASNTKSFDAFSGVAFLKQAAMLLEDSKIPGFAIGGIDINNVCEVIAAGFQRVAVSGAIWKASDPADAAKRMRQELG